MSLVLWLIGHPWPKEVAIHAAAAAAPQPLSPIAAPLPIGDAESDCDDGAKHGLAVYVPDVPHNSMRGRQSTHESFWPRASRTRALRGPKMGSKADWHKGVDPVGFRREPPTGEGGLSAGMAR